MIHCDHRRHHSSGRRRFRHAASLRRSRNRWRQKALGLKDAMVRYNTIFENTGTATILIEADFTISAINDGFARLMGMHPKEIEGRIKWPEFIHTDDLERMRHYHVNRRADPDTAPRNYEFRLLSRTRGTREVAITIDMVPGTSQSVASLMDVTDTRRLEREVIAVGERERRRIGRDLHDDLGSHLSGVELLSKVLQKKIARCSPEASREMETIRTLITDAIEKTRRLSQGLYPVHIVEHGLEAAMEALAAEIEDIYGITLDLAFDPAVDRLENTAATHLYYVAREAAFNAARHARPTTLGITADAENGRFSVRIRDNGRWSDDRRTPEQPEGMGLHTMAYRARAMGAMLSIDTDDGGTRVVLSGTLPATAGVHGERGGDP
jgi:PAS domain S-box-containing protein